jgi:DASH complex subunit Dad2
MELKVWFWLVYADLGVAGVLANWQNVFRAINLATGSLPFNRLLIIVKMGSLGGQEQDERNLPEMLVRIPVNTDTHPADLEKPTS